MTEMIKMIADAPQEQQKAMITQRLNMIAAQPDEQRVNSVKGIMMGGFKLKAKKMEAFVINRTNAMMEMEAEPKQALIVARVKTGAQVPEDVNKKDMMAIVKCAMEWPAEKRNMFMESMGQVFNKLDMPKPDFQAMMEQMK